MECKILRDYLEEHGCAHAPIPEEIEKHLLECPSCKGQFRLTAILGSLNCQIEQAPKDILTNVEARIDEVLERKAQSKSFFRFEWVCKPSYAIFTVLVMVVAIYVYLTNTSIGQVENLSERFKIAQFHDIKSGNLLYVGDNTSMTIQLHNRSTVQIYRNSLIKVNNSRKVTLLAGELSIQSGNEELQIETPDGLVRARNTNAKILTTAAPQKSASKTETICVVFNGTTTIACSSQEMNIDKGQKVAFTEGKGITFRKFLTTTESESEKNNVVPHKIVAAIGSLCDCAFNRQRISDTNNDHSRKSGSKTSENKFKVRIFWQEKGLKGLVLKEITDTHEI